MVSKLILDNFKSFNHFEVDFYNNKVERTVKNLVMIYGENGIGKSSIVEAFKFLSSSFFSIIRLKSIDKIIREYGKDDVSLRFSFSKLLNENDLSTYIRAYKTISATSPMRVSFEFIIKGNKYAYDSYYDSDMIIEEKLTYNAQTIFSVMNNNLRLSDKHFHSKDFNSLIVRYFNLYYGKHSLLACINQAGLEINNESRKNALSKEMVFLMAEIEQMFIYVNNDSENMEKVVVFGGESHHAGLLSNMIEGRYGERMKEKLEKTKLALSMFYSSLYSNIVGVDYKIETDKNGGKRYSLFFLERINDKTIKVPYARESTGTRKLVSLFGMLYSLCISDITIVIDEIDNGINDILLKTIVDSLSDTLKGQLIFTTHDTLLLGYSNKNSTYVLNREPNNDISIYSLSEFGRKIQKGTDVIKQYIKGLYGGVPQSNMFSMQYIVEGVKKL